MVGQDLKSWVLLSSHSRFLGLSFLRAAGLGGRMPWLAVLQQTKGPPRPHLVPSAHFAHEGTEAENAGVGFWGARQRRLWKCTLALSRAADGHRGFGGGLGLSF